MPHFHVHYVRKWKRALPHFDVRICPECGALVFKQEGQARHKADHDHLREVLVKLAERVQIPVETLEEAWTWTAAVDTPELEAEPLRMLGDGQT